MVFIAVDALCGCRNFRHRKRLAVGYKGALPLEQRYAQGGRDERATWQSETRKWTNAGSKACTESTARKGRSGGEYRAGSSEVAKHSTAVASMGCGGAGYEAAVKGNS